MFLSLVSLVLIIIGARAYSWVHSINEVEGICKKSELKTNISVVLEEVGLSKYAKVDGPIEREGNIAYVLHSPESVGRGICVVEVENQLVSLVAYFEEIKENYSYINKY